MQMNWEWQRERGRGRELVGEWKQQNEIEMNILCNSFALHFKYSCIPEKRLSYVYRQHIQLCVCVCLYVLFLYSLYCFYCPPCYSIVMGLNSQKSTSLHTHTPRTHTHTHICIKLMLCAYLRNHLKYKKKKETNLRAWKSLHFILLSPSQENKNFPQQLLLFTYFLEAWFLNIL